MNAFTKKIAPKNYFSFALYIKCIKELLPLAIVCFLLISIIAAFEPSMVLRINREHIYCLCGAMKHFPDYLSTIHLYAIFLFAAPLLTIASFSFLTKRNTCDAIHSLPYKRACIFITHIAAIISWLLILTISNSIVTKYIYKIVSPKMFFYPEEFKKMVISVFVCAVFVTMVFAIGCGLTGRLFTNIIMSLIILILPRLLTGTVVLCLEFISPFFIKGHASTILNPFLNLVFAGFNIGEVYNGIPESFMSKTSIIYTLVITAIYFFIALFVFIKRPSELSEHATRSKLFQFILRICSGLPISLIAVYMVFQIIVSMNSSLIATNIFITVIAEIFCIIAMFLFELFSMRKVKKAFKACLSFGALFILQVGILLFILGLYSYELNYSPEKEEIDYVMIDLCDANILYNKQNDTFYDALSACRFENEEMIEFVSQKLNFNVKSIKQGYKNKLFTPYNLSLTYGYSYIKVGINTGSSTKYRQILLLPDERSIFISLVKASPEMNQLFNNFPGVEEITSVKIYNNYDYAPEIYKPVYESLVKEVSKMDLNTKLSHLYGELAGANFEFETLPNNHTQITINKDTPNTLLTLYNVSNANAKEQIDEIIKKLEKPFAIQNANLHCYLYTYDYGLDYDSITHNVYDKNVLKMLDAIRNDDFKEFTSLEIPKNHKLVRIKFEQIGIYYESTFFEYYLYMTEDEINKILYED